ncbi:MAG: formylmethanofuran--tetrahydromethanopterin N-formyltransferase [Desulfurococcales archaeon ex4484_217_2]|nr:MAG: formylmethanofuran--tetrahydromethanopterin N-formyltransferase [Desulfurococcales archaeon ex4484_217_2]
MKIDGVEIEETFAEAFPMYAARILITAKDYKWAEIAGLEATGFGSSVIMSPAESGIERFVPPEKTPDKRPGVLIQIFQKSYPELRQQVIARVSQCILTAPTTRAFDGLPQAKRKMRIGSVIAKFGDGFEKKVKMFGRDMWVIPVMEGEFMIEETIAAVKGVAGGNLFILAENMDAGLEAAVKAVEAIRKHVPGVIMPFPGGVVRAGSKVGSLKYPKLTATTNHKYCPTLRGIAPDNQIPEGVKSVYEIVINGLTVKAVTKAMGVGIKAAAKVPGVVKITAGNFGGRRLRI